MFSNIALSQRFLVVSLARNDKMEHCLLFLVDTAEVENYLVLVPWKGLELVVCCEHYNDVGFVECLLIWSELKLFVFLNIWLYNHNIGIITHLHNFAYDGF